MAGTAVPAAMTILVGEAATLVGGGTVDMAVAAGMGVKGEVAGAAAACSTMASCGWSCWR